MKIIQKTLFFIAVTATVLVLLVPVLTIKNFKAYDSSVTVNEQERLISSDSDSITLLQITDIQTKDLIECGMAYPTVKYLVEKHRPDMIVLTGDNISNGATTEVLSAMIDLFDSFELPWALVLGNHDRDSDVPLDKMCKALEKSEYCIFNTGYLDDRYGNYYYNVELNGETVRSLIFMDSERSGFTEKQVEWYRNTIRSIADSEGKVVPSIAFFHIPIQETVDANELYAVDPSVGSGETREEICTQDKNSFFEAVKELGSTDGLFYGHDHVNNSIVEYEGVLFCYGMKSAMTVTYDRDMIGGNLITITADGFTVERVK